MLRKKRILLFISFIASIILVLIPIYGTYTLCNNNESCVSLLYYFFFYGMFFLPLFILSLITYKLRDEVFKTWLHFVYWWVPLSVFLVFITPDSNPSILPIVTKGPVALLMSFLFLIISLIIIIIRFFTSRNK